MMITGPSAHCVALGNLCTGYGYETVREAAGWAPSPGLGRQLPADLSQAASGTATLWSHRRERPGPDDTPGLSSPCYS